MTKGRYVIAVQGVAIFLEVSDIQLFSCRAHQPTEASWRRLTRLTNRQIGINTPHHAVWIMPRKY